MTHLPDHRWRCRACDDPWPCEAARANLLAEYADDLPALAVLMATYLWDAIVDLDGPRGAAWSRFLGWVRRAAMSDELGGLE